MNKKLKFSQLIVLIGFFFPAISHSGDSLYEQVVGNATDLQSAKSLYREVHCGAANELVSDVFYQSTEGNLIAHKSLDYKSGRTTPSFIQAYTLSQERIDVQFDQTTLTMSMINRDGKESNQQYQVSTLDDLPVVIDAGFDIFIQDNWPTLMSDKTIGFQFPLVSRNQLISLQIKKSVCQYETNTDQCFTLEPSNWLFRMLASPIELGYDLTLMRLNRYRGLSNINDADGAGLVVDIKYQYQQADVPCSVVKDPKSDTS